MRTFKDLLDRVAAVQGVPFAELAAAHGIEWSTEPARNKGLAGRIAEAALGIPQNPLPRADLAAFGLEVKTIPIGRDLKVLENTKISNLNFKHLIEQEEFVSSDVSRKLRSIIFAPVVKFDIEHPEQWYIRSPFIWMPSLDVQEQLEHDYRAIRGVVIAGRLEEVSSARPPNGQGEYMMANTAGRDSRDTTTFTYEGREFTTKRRAWMLRKSFTEMMVRENLTYRPPGGPTPARMSRADAHEVEPVRE